MPKYYQASYLGPQDTPFQFCDTSQTTIEKRAKEKVIREGIPVYVEAVEIAPLSLKGFVNTLNLVEKPISREVIAVFAPRQTGKGHLVAKKLKLEKVYKQTNDISFHPNFRFLSEIA